MTHWHRATRLRAAARVLLLAATISVPTHALAGGVQPPALAYDTIFSLEWEFGGATTSGGRYSVGISQEIRPESFSGAEPLLAYNFWDRSTPITEAEEFDLAASIALEVDGSTTQDTSTSDAYSNSLRLWRGRNGWTESGIETPLPGWDRVGLRITGSRIDFAFTGEDTTSFEEWPGELLVGFVPSAFPELDFWNEGPPIIDIELDGMSIGAESPDSFSYRVSAIRFVPEPGTGVLVLAGLALGSAARRRGGRTG